MRTVGAALATAMALALGASAALADAPAPGTPIDPDVARADQLFNEAQSMLAAGDLEPACAKFDESLKLNRQAIGTLLNVARCDARFGRTAHAVTLYTEARDRGREQHLEAYTKAAEEQLEKLAPLVPHLAIALSAPAAGEKLTVDDQLVASGAAGTPGDVPLDPGAHTVVVSAPGRASFTTVVKLQKSEHRTLAVPALAVPTAPSSARTVGKLLVVGGGVAAAAGLTLGVVAKLRYDDADCTGGRCTADGFAKTESARSLGNVGTVVGAVGLATAAVGAVIWWRSPSAHAEHEQAVTIAPFATPTEAGFVAAGRF